MVYSGRSAQHDPEQESVPDDLKNALADMAARIQDRGMKAPAIIAIEMLKPLGFIGSQLLLMLAPLQSHPIDEGSRRWADILEDRASIEYLLNLLRDESPTS